MNTTERVKMVKAMEYIVRQLNNTDIIEKWLLLGVPDEDISYGDLSDNADEATDFWIEDEHFSDLMGLFLEVMALAKKDGGLYCDEVLSA